jgi:hypothetical protein
LTWLYVRHASLPALAGMLLDLTESLVASRYFSAALAGVVYMLFNAPVPGMNCAHKV